MHYGLPPHLSYCLIDGRTIFLDIDRDLYFRLESSLEQGFLSYVHAEDGDQSHRDALLERGILIPGSDRTNLAHRTLLQPSQSLIELRDRKVCARLADVLEILLIVLRFHRHLKTLPLKSILDSLKSREAKGHLGMWRAAPHDPQILDAAEMFMQARRFVPIETSCLLDSLSLIRYLDKRGMTAELVFGVTDAPFSAHCWVQAGCVVLNDTVGNAMAHTPIRVI